MGERVGEKKKGEKRGKEEEKPAERSYLIRRF